MLLGGRKITAAEACDRGLVTRVIPANEFQNNMKEIMSYMAALPPKVETCNQPNHLKILLSSPTNSHFRSRRN